LGPIYEQLGEFGKAATILRAYTRRNPGDADGQRELSQACLKRDEKGGARLAAGNADTLDAKNQTMTATGL
jgi:predicted Zn-dependent protease